MCSAALAGTLLENVLGPEHIFKACGAFQPGLPIKSLLLLLLLLLLLVGHGCSSTAQLVPCALNTEASSKSLAFVQQCAPALHCLHLLTQAITSCSPQRVHGSTTSPPILQRFPHMTCCVYMSMISLSVTVCISEPATIFSLVKVLHAVGNPDQTANHHAFFDRSKHYVTPNF